ncbi:MAG: hypothetical protein NTY68_00240 [Candidatus Micrarchaeota archaeon]|nr:hypothetical protein [Candidatus Micrarchaeota archaeon]
MKAFEAMISLLLLVMAVPMLELARGNESSVTIRYIIAEDMLNSLYSKYGMGIAYPENRYAIEQDIAKMSKETGNCIEFATPYWQTSECPGNERITATHNSIVGNVRLSIIK